MIHLFPALHFLFLIAANSAALSAAGPTDPKAIQLWIDRAVESSERIENLEALSFAHYQLARVAQWPFDSLRIDVLLKLDREEDAIKAMEQTTSNGVREFAASAIAIHRIKKGDTDGGLSLIENNVGYPSSGSDKGWVALALMQKAGIDRAVDFLNGLDVSKTSAGAFTQVARTLTETGRLNQLEKLYDALESPFARAHLAIEAANRLLWLAEAPGDNAD